MITNAYNSAECIPDFLSENAIQIKIIDNGVNNENRVLKKLNVLKDFLNEVEIDFILYKDYQLINGKGVFINNFENFNPNIVEGRNLKQSDFDYNKNCILINKKLLKNIINEEFIFENVRFDIIGTFENNNNTSRYNSNIYFNMMTDEFIDKAILDGTYILDAGNNVDIFMKKIKQYFNNLDPDLMVYYSNLNNSNMKNLKVVLSEEYFSVAMIVIAVLLLFINIFSATYNWIDARKDEIFVRLLCGANRKKICIKLLLQYEIIIISSLLIGTAIAMFVISSNIFPVLGYEVYLTGAKYSLIICVLIGTISGFITINRKIKKLIGNNY